MIYKYLNSKKEIQIKNYTKKMSLDQNPKNLELKKPPTLKLKNYELLKVLGEGSFGWVKLVKNLKTNKYCAFK